MRARVAQSERGPDLHECVVDSDRHLHRNVELPAELARVRQACRRHTRGCERNLAAGEERKRTVAEILAGELLQQAPRKRPHDAQHREAAGDVDDADTLAR